MTQRQLDPELVSIITPAYNAGRFIEATIQSVQSQTWENWEMLIVLDRSSTDNSAEIIMRCAQADDRLRVLDAPVERSVTDARNHGLSQARGRWVAFLDADDLWMPNKLDQQLKIMRETGAPLTYTGFRRLSLDGSTTGRYIGVPAQVTYTDLLKHNPIACVSVVIDQEATGPLSMGDDNEVHEDLALWMDILRPGRVARGVAEDLCRYRIVPGSRSSSKKLAASWRWRMYREKEQLSGLRSAWYFSWYMIMSVAKHLRF